MPKVLHVREATEKLINLAEEGVLSWEAIARAALNYMSEDDVKDMAECNEFIEDNFEDNSIAEDVW